MARELLKMAVDENVSDSVKLAAIRDAFDRGGVGAKTEVDMSISAKPFEQTFDKMESGSRSAYRRSLGIADDSEDVTSTPQAWESPALVDSLRADDDDDLIVEGEIVDAEDQNQVNGDEGDGPPPPFCGPERQPWADEYTPFGGLLGATGPAGSGMMPLTDAVAAQAEMRKHAVLRPITRALPRGRS